ncbi:hypothetical protein Pelo_4555 [Pelomyxa schiedti]|nr:hypothetical protein Pelo_4555 [Pelomyxa schiedti]
MGQSFFKCVQTCGMCMRRPVALNEQDDYWKPSKQLAAEMEAAGVDLSDHPVQPDAVSPSATLSISPAVPSESQDECEQVGSPKKVKIVFSKQ